MKKTVLTIALAALAACSRQASTSTASNGTPASAAAPDSAKPSAMPAPAPVPAPAPPEPVVIPAGTVIKVRTTTTLSTKSHKAGESFAASLLEPIVINGKVLAPRNANVRGVVASSDPGGRVKGRAVIGVRLVSFETDANRNITITTNSFVRQAAGTKRKDAAKIGVGSGAGAAIGAIAGGGMGAAIGAAAGAGAGTGLVLATHGDPAVIPSESVISFQLRSPVTI